MKSPVTYKAPMGSLCYTKCTMELPRGHIIVYRTNQRRIYRDLVFQMDIFLRIFQIWTFFRLSIYIERRKNVHIPYYLTRNRVILYGDLFERSEIAMWKMKKLKLYLSKTEKPGGKIQVLSFLRNFLKTRQMEKSILYMKDDQSFKI